MGCRSAETMDREGFKDGREKQKLSGAEFAENWDSRFRMGSSSIPQTSLAVGFRQLRRFGLPETNMAPRIQQINMASWGGSFWILDRSDFYR